ncbi:MAG: hypothetical protein VX871_10790 [Pseudomonadota bacterium]|nr:hypothetical protein [Pseudomonadota bacterium]
MTSVAIAWLELASVVAVAWLILLIILVARHPAAPRWLKSEAAAQSIAFVLIAAISISLTVAMNGVSALGFTFYSAFAALTALFGAALVLGWIVAGMSARLRRADNGQSPFAPAPGTVPPGATAHP